MTAAEKQYIDLFRDNYNLLCAPANDLLNRYRESAFSRFKELGFPVFGSEDYKYTNPEEAFGPDWGLNINRLDFPVNPYEVFKCDVPNLSTSLYFMVNDKFYHKEAPSTKLPEGVFVGSLNEFATVYPSVAEKYYARIASENDGLVAFNTMMVQDGFVFYVPDRVVVERPVQLVNILRSTIPLLMNRRILIILGKQAQAKLLVCDHTMDDGIRFLVSQVVEIYAEENAHFDYYELEETGENTTRFSSLYLEQAAASNVLVNGITLTNGMSRNNYYVRLNGEYAETNLSGMAISDKEQHLDTYSHITHAVPHCHSDELFKYVLNDRALGVFSGRILVKEDAQKTTAYQNNRNLCATREARMYSKPQLEIYADDVKCSHGMTTGQLDEKALFYMRSRGIPEAEARMLLMVAFTSDVIDNVRLDALRDRLHKLVEKRFRGELAKCAGCRICK